MVNVDNRPGGPRRDSNNTLYFIVGALVIAVLIIGWFMYGGDDVDDADVNVTTEQPATTPAVGTETNVTVEPAAPAATAPAADTATTPAPATDTATTPAPATDTTGGGTTGGATDTTGGATTGGATDTTGGATTGGATDTTGGATTGGTTGGATTGGTTTTP